MKLFDDWILDSIFWLMVAGIVAAAAWLAILVDGMLS